MSGILQIGYPIGWFLASQFVLFMSDRWGWRSVFFVALLSVPYMFVIQKYLRETGAFIKAKEASERAENPVARGRFAELFAPRMAYRSIVLFLGEYFHVFAYGSTILLTAYFQEFRSFSMRDAVSLVGWSYGVGAIGYIVAAIVGEFFISRRTTCIIWAWLGSAAFFVMIWWARDYWTTVLFYCLMTIFFYGTTAVKFTFIAENFPARLRATGVTFSGSLAVNLGIATGPLALSYAVAWFDGDFQPRQVEQVVHQAQHALAGGLDVAEHALQPGLGPSAQVAQLREAQDRLQRRAQLVADVGQELALGGVGPFGRLLGLDRAQGRLAELGHVHQAADHAGDLAVDSGVGHQADHHVAWQAVGV